MKTYKKKIEKRWRITRWHFDDKRELTFTDVLTTKPMTERKARNLIKEEVLGRDCCWMIRAYYR